MFPKRILNGNQNIFSILGGFFEHFKRVLLVCHKNKWRDLSQKFVTYLFLFKFLFIEGGQENIFIGPKNIFDQ